MRTLRPVPCFGGSHSFVYVLRHASPLSKTSHFWELRTTHKPTKSTNPQTKRQTPLKHSTLFATLRRCVNTATEPVNLNYASRRMLSDMSGAEYQACCSIVAIISAVICVSFESTCQWQSAILQFLIFCIINTTCALGFIRICNQLIWICRLSKTTVSTGKVNHLLAFDTVRYFISKA